MARDDGDSISNFAELANTMKQTKFPWTKSTITKSSLEQTGSFLVRSFKKFQLGQSIKSIVCIYIFRNYSLNYPSLINIFTYLASITPKFYYC